MASQTRFWMITDKGDPWLLRLVDGWFVDRKILAKTGAPALYLDPHYSRQNPGSKLCTRNGQNLVFMTADNLAAWVTFRPTPGKATRADKLDAWECALFRNEGQLGACHILSSLLIEEAVELSVSLWGPLPRDGFITFIKPECIKSKNPGFSYKKAGWYRWGQSSDGKPRFRAPDVDRARHWSTWSFKGDRGGSLRETLYASI